jgi:SAM-dependent methyltransferase
VTLSQSPSGDWIAVHRSVWSRKPILRAVYERWFDVLHAQCLAGLPVIELGCGSGFFKQRYPDVVATDTAQNPYADRLVDAGALPFDDASVGSLVLLDVFHHLPDPARFLTEAARVLVAGGRVAMIEPWVGLAGRLLYRYVHHEECDLSIDPAAPWSSADKDPLQGNAALPYLYFQPRGRLEALGLPLAVVRREPFAALPWLLSGGFQPFSLLPVGLVSAAQILDRVLSAAPALTATRCIVTLERRR